MNEASAFSSSFPLLVTKFPVETTFIYLESGKLTNDLFLSLGLLYILPTALLRKVTSRYCPPSKTFALSNDNNVLFRIRLYQFYMATTFTTNIPMDIHFSFSMIDLFTICTDVL